FAREHAIAEELVGHFEVAVLGRAREGPALGAGRASDLRPGGACLPLHHERRPRRLHARAAASSVVTQWASFDWSAGSRMSVTRYGRSPRAARVSRSITSMLAPTYGARTRLLMTRRSE